MAKNVAPIVGRDRYHAGELPVPAPTLPVTATNTITLPPLGQRKRTNGPSISLERISSSQTMNYAKGIVGVRWAASDPNGDDLIYTVHIRGVQEKEWKLLRDKLKEKFLSWESNTFPDGEYILRVTASDSPDNPPDQALTRQYRKRAIHHRQHGAQDHRSGRLQIGSKVTVRWRAPTTAALFQRPSTRSTGVTGLWFNPPRVCPMLLSFSTS